MKAAALTISIHSRARPSSFFFQRRKSMQPKVIAEHSPRNPRYNGTHTEVEKKRGKLTDSCSLGPEPFLICLLELHHAPFLSSHPPQRHASSFSDSFKAGFAGSLRGPFSLSQISNTRCKGAMTGRDSVRPSGSQSRTHPVLQTEKPH